MIEIFREIAKREKAINKYRPYWSFRFQLIGCLLTLFFAIKTFNLPISPACFVAALSLGISRYVLLYNQARKGGKKK